MYSVQCTDCGAMCLVQAFTHIRSKKLRENTLYILPGEEFEKFSRTNFVVVVVAVCDGTVLLIDEYIYEHGSGFGGTIAKHDTKM